MQRILYIQHAGALGGSCMSLLYLLQGLDRSCYEPIVACIHPTPAVLELYEDHGFETLYWPGITPFEHTTLAWMPLFDPLALIKLLYQVAHYRYSALATEKLIDHVKPDLVHLNSLVLAPSALGGYRSNIPVVWHVREPVHLGHFGFRRAWLRRQFMKLANKGIFISEFDRRQLTRDTKGTVIHNFVNFSRFDRNLVGASIRTELGLSPRARVILFLGGRSIVKGTFPLLEAMPLIRSAIPEVHLLVAGGAYHFSGRLTSRIARTLFPLVGYGTIAQRVDRLLKRFELHDCVHLLEWRDDVPSLLAASDILVFPSTEPHFARPVIEAGAMSKPVVASQLGGVEELVEDGVTGLLVPPNDPEALAEATIRILRSSEIAEKMGRAGLAQARARFSQNENVRATVELYDCLLRR